RPSRRGSLGPARRRVLSGARAVPWGAGNGRIQGRSAVMANPADRVAGDTDGPSMVLLGPSGPRGFLLAPGRPGALCIPMVVGESAGGAAAPGAVLAPAGRLARAVVTGPPNPGPRARMPADNGTRPPTRAERSDHRVNRRAGCPATQGEGWGPA